MFMPGDIKNIVDQVNQVVEALSVRISVLEDELIVLKAAKTTKSTTKSTKVDTSE